MMVMDSARSTITTVLAVLAVFAAPAVMATTTSSPSLDAQWLKYLEMPPLRAVSAAAVLMKRADAIIQALPRALNLTGHIDVVCSGGGNLDAFYAGVRMVLARAPALSLRRFSGASAGGMYPFELALKGERTTLLTHLSFGVLSEEWPLSCYAC